jgi:hypothetical protein
MQSQRRSAGARAQVSQAMGSDAPSQLKRDYAQNLLFNVNKE